MYYPADGDSQTCSSPLNQSRVAQAAVAVEEDDESNMMDVVKGICVMDVVKEICQDASKAASDDISTSELQPSVTDSASAANEGQRRVFQVI